MKAVIKQEDNRTQSFLISLAFHTLLVLMMFLYTFTKKPESTEVPPISIEWGGGGDNAAAGEPDKGMNDDYTPPGEDQPSTPSKPSTSTPDPTPTPTPTTKPSTPPAPVSTSEDPDAAAIRQQKEKDRKEAERQEQARQAAETAKRQAEEAAKKAAEDQRNKVKNNAGSAFGKPGSTGSGAGGGGKPGNGGIPGGTGDNPFGKSNGTGGGTGGGDGTGTGASIGGGLGGRKVVARGRINDTSQKEGRVVIAVCVDSEGKVTSAEYKLSGSTTSDSELKNKAIAAAKAYRFGTSEASQECGSITFNFKLQ